MPPFGEAVSPMFIRPSFLVRLRSSSLSAARCELGSLSRAYGRSTRKSTGGSVENEDIMKRNGRRSLRAPPRLVPHDRRGAAASEGI